MALFLLEEYIRVVCICSYPEIILRGFLVRPAPRIIFRPCFPSALIPYHAHFPIRANFHLANPSKFARTIMGFRKGSSSARCSSRIRFLPLPAATSELQHFLRPFTSHKNASPSQNLASATGKLPRMCGPIS